MSFQETCAREAEDFVHAVVFPDHVIGFRIPLEHAQGRTIGRNAQARLAVPQRRFGALALGDIEVHAKDAA
jgi:hypothetical protein